MKQFMARLARYLKSEGGATATEYAIMLVLVLMVIIVTVAALGIQVDRAFEKFLVVYNSVTN